MLTRTIGYIFTLSPLAILLLIGFFSEFPQIIPFHSFIHDSKKEIWHKFLLNTSTESQSEWNLKSPSNTSHTDSSIENTKLYSSTSTGIYEFDFLVQWISMQPLLKNGQIVKVEMNYYNQPNQEIQKWDVVVFENPFQLNRIIKRVMISPGAFVQKNPHNSTLIVDGEILKNSEWKPYIFDSQAYKYIDIYTKSGAISPNSYFLLGDNIHGSIDSRSFWPVTKEGILWKVKEKFLSKGVSWR